MSNPILALTRRAAIASAACLTLRAGAVLAAETAGQVESVRGEASAQAGRNLRSLAAGAAVFVGDVVETRPQSFLALRLGAATVVHLGPDARLAIDRFLMNAGGVLELARGAMLFDHDQPGAKPDVVVRSPFGLIAVRGTRYFAGPSNGVFGVFVERGAVTVAGANSFVVLEAAFGTDIAKPGAEPTLPIRWGKPRIDRAFASVLG